MQQDRVGNLKKLINISAILNEAEKREWLALLELMNDKQAGELEKILSSTQFSVPSSQYPVLSTQFPSKSPTPQLPPLTHIVNMPSGVTPKFEAYKEKNIPSQPPLILRGGEKILPPLKIRGGVGGDKEKEKAGFWQKIRDILAEKELPEGHPSAVEELELPAASIKEINIPSQPPLILRGGEKILPPLKIRGGVGGDMLKVPVPKRKQPPGKARDFQPQQPLSPAPKVQPVSEILQKISSPPQPKIATVDLEERIKTAPGVKLPEVPQDRNLKGFEPLGPARDLRPAKSAMPSALAKAILTVPRQSSGPSAEGKAYPKAAAPDAAKSNLPQPEYSRAVESIAKDSHPGGAALGNLPDLSQLRPSDLSAGNIPNIVKKLKSMVAAFGYHQAMFNLEKSPLYKAYLNTGTEALGQKGGFDQLAQKNPRDYLSREAFEKFTDLLMEMQAG